MSIEILRIFFGWMTLLTLGLIVFWAFWIMLAPDLVYKIQTKFINVERNYFDKVMYAFLGLAKLLFLFFCAAPYIALVIMTS